MTIRLALILVLLAHLIGFAAGARITKSLYKQYPKLPSDYELICVDDPEVVGITCMGYCGP